MVRIRALQLIVAFGLLVSATAARADTQFLLHDIEDGLFVRNWNRLFFEVEPGRVSSIAGFDGGANVTNTEDYTLMYFIGGVPSDQGDLGTLMVSWGIHWMFAKLEPNGTPAFWIDDETTKVQGLRGMFALMLSETFGLPLKLQAGGYVRWLGHQLETASPILTDRPYLVNYLDHDQNEVDFGAIYHVAFDGKSVVSNLTYKGAEFAGTPTYLAQDLFLRLGNFVAGPYYTARSTQDELVAVLQVGARAGMRMPGLGSLDVRFETKGGAATGDERFQDALDDALGFDEIAVRVDGELETGGDTPVFNPLFGAWHSTEHGAGGRLGARLVLIGDEDDRLYMDVTFSYNELEVDPLLGRSDGLKFMFDYAI